jgi:hypothetical protein
MRKNSLGGVVVNLGGGRGAAWASDTAAV